MAGQGDFGAQVSDWVRQTEQRLAAVFHESTQRVIEEMQTPVGEGGNMPIDTGFLRASLQVASEMPVARGRQPQEGRTYTYDAGPIALTIAGAALGQAVYAIYGANYAAAQEYGSKGRAGRQFVALAAQKWPVIVSAVCRDLQASVVGSTPGT